MYSPKIIPISNPKKKIWNFPSKHDRYQQTAQHRGGSPIKRTPYSTRAATQQKKHSRAINEAESRAIRFEIGHERHHLLVRERRRRRYLWFWWFLPLREADRAERAVAPCRWCGRKRNTWVVSTKADRQRPWACFRTAASSSPAFVLALANWDFARMGYSSRSDTSINYLPPQQRKTSEL